jgi:hypothetical protein
LEWEEKNGRREGKLVIGHGQKRAERKETNLQTSPCCSEDITTGPQPSSNFAKNSFMVSLKSQYKNNLGPIEIQFSRVIIPGHWRKHCFYFLFFILIKKFPCIKLKISTLVIDS